MTPRDELIEEIARHLRQLSPHMKDRQQVILLEKAHEHLKVLPSIEELQDCHYRRIAAEEERELLRNNLAARSDAQGAICGIIKRKDGQNSPCKGAAKIALRECYTEGELIYFRGRLRNRIHAMVLDYFIRLVRDKGFTKDDLARRLDKRPEQITRWLGSPSNLTLDTVSDLLLGMGHEPLLGAVDLSLGAVLPSSELWKLAEATKSPETLPGCGVD